MKVLLQRVTSASVCVDQEVIGEIEQGLLLLVGIGSDDGEENLAPMADKIANMRVFPDEKGRFHYSLQDINGSVLLVPQFTLYADTSKGRRPEFFGAMKPPEAEQMFEQFVSLFKEKGLKKIASGRFGAYMQVELVNDGPVTISLEN